MISRIQDALAKKKHMDDLLCEELHSLQFNKVVNLNQGSISSIAEKSNHLSSIETPGYVMQPHYNHYIYEDLTSNRFEYEEAKSVLASHKTSAHLNS